MSNLSNIKKIKITYCCILNMIFIYLCNLTSLSIIFVDSREYAVNNDNIHNDIG